MTRNEYLNVLYHSLTFLPDEERLALVRSYDDYIESSLRQGRSEEELYRELGDPSELALRIRGARQTPPRPDPRPMPPPAPYPIDPPAPRTGGPARWLGMGIVLFFLNLAAVPTGIGLWSALASFGAASVAALFAPFAVLLDWVRIQEFYPATLFASIAATGAGLLMMALFVLLFKAACRATAAYARWNLRTWRGW